MLTREAVDTRNLQRQQMLQRLDSRNNQVSQQAIHDCLVLPPNEISTLIHMAHAARAKKASLSTRQQKYAMALFLIALFLWYGVCRLYNIGLAPILWLMLWVTVLAAGIYANSQRARPSCSGRAKWNLAAVVHHMQNPAFLPEAMRMLYASSPYMSSSPHIQAPVLTDAFFETATRLLLTQTNEQIYAFGIQQQAFCRFLTPARAWGKSHITLRVLDYLTEFGTPSAIEVVSVLAANRLGQPIFAGSKAIQKAAQTCLQALQQRAYENNQPNILLRASSVPSASPETLLRAVLPGASNDSPDHLLRPAVKMQDEAADSGKLMNESN